MSKVFIAFFAALLLLAGVFALLSLSHEAAAQSPSTCQNAIDDDPFDDGLINDGCPQVGPLTENLVCVNATDDDPTDDPNDRVNDGCPLKGSFADCDSNTDGDCADAGEPAKCQEAVTGVDDDADTVVNDGCPINGTNPENDPQCVNTTDDDVAINDGCPLKGEFADCDSNSDGDCADVGEAALCANAVDDDGDTNVNDGCPTVGSLPENPACVNAIDDDAADDPDDRVNDGCPTKGTFADCDSNTDGDCGDPGEAALCQEAVTGIDNDADTRVNDGCPINGTNAENPSCANATDDDDVDGYINDGCTKLGDYSEAGSVGGLAELPDVAGDSGSSAGTYAALAGGLAAAVLALGAGAWYARRRLS